ncbi:Protein kinase domain-containing protein [Fusarium sp. LHS14.1]|nr:Protein kinase domain-containing protein [Fusarium sp. LHS14.1]
MSMDDPNLPSEMCDDALGGGAAFASISMLELSRSDFGVEYAFIYNCVRVYVIILSQDLEGEGSILNEFDNFRIDLDDPDTLFQFEEWILGPLQPFLDREAPTPSRHKPMSLLQYFSPRTFAFKFVNNEGQLDAMELDYDPAVNGDYSPKTHIVDVPASSPQLRGHQSKGGVVLRSELPSVPLIAASELVRAENSGDEEISDIPRKVQRRSEPDHPLFFKAGLRDHGHLREMELLGKITHSGRFESPWKTSKFVGLVVWDDDPNCLMGLLMQYIDGKTLRDRSRDAPEVLKKKWIDQVEATLRRLHEVGITWGDVKPDNVMNDASEDAVLVDFGGGYTDYIPHELQQTPQGDLIGLDHMRAAMGV